MKTTRSIMNRYTATLCAAALLLLGHTAAQAQLKLPTLSGTETIRIANVNNPSNFTSTATVKGTIYKSTVPTPYSYTNNPAEPGTIFLAGFIGITNGGASVFPILLWTNTTGKVLSAQNNVISAQVKPFADRIEITVNLKDPMVSFMGSSPIQYFNFLESGGTYLNDFADEYGSIAYFLMIDKNNNACTLVGGADASTKKTLLRGGKAIIKNKIIGVRF